MASPEVENASSDPQPVAGASTSGSQPRKSVFTRIWNSIFKSNNEDFEKKLQHLSKEEAAVHARSKRRSQTWRKMARVLLIYSVVFEFVAIVIAIISTRAPDLTWQIRALRVLPVFALPGFSALLYSTCARYVRMRERKDQKTLDRLRAERQAKIDELKERTNYYLTQQLIQRYDLDPAAKAAAASVLVSKLGAETGLNVSIKDDTGLAQNQGRSSNIEFVESTGLRNRKQSHGRSQSVGSIAAEQLSQEPTASTVHGNPQDGIRQQGFVVEHNQRARASEGGWIARLAAMLVGEDPTQCYALICGSCHMHNGLARKEDFPYITYYCPHCNALNGSRPSEAGHIVDGSGRSDSASATTGNGNMVGERLALDSGDGSVIHNEVISKLVEASVSQAVRETEGTGSREAAN